MKKTNYPQNGFENQEEYFNSLATQYGVELETVYELASMYGKKEDFGALVIALKIYETDVATDSMHKFSNIKESELLKDLQLFEENIFPTIFNNLTSKTKFTFSRSAVENISLELSIKFDVLDSEFTFSDFRDLFMEVCERVSTNNELFHDYYLDKSIITTLHKSELLNSMIKGAIKKQGLLFDLENETVAKSHSLMEYAIMYGIIFMISKNYFIMED